MSRPPRRQNPKQSSGAGAKGLAATSRSARTPRHLLLYPSFMYVPVAILVIDAAQLIRNEYEASYEIFSRTASPVPKILTVASPLHRVSPEDGNAYASRCSGTSKATSSEPILNPRQHSNLIFSRVSEHYATQMPTSRSHLDLLETLNFPRSRHYLPKRTVTPSGLLPVT